MKLKDAMQIVEQMRYRILDNAKIAFQDDLHRVLRMQEEADALKMLLGKCKAAAECEELIQKLRAEPTPLTLEAANALVLLTGGAA